MSVLAGFSVIILIVFNAWALITEPIESNRYTNSN